MGLEKAIEHGKEHRKPYPYCKQIDPSCRNHGGCQWCEGNRKHKYIVRQRKIDARLAEYFFDEIEENT